MSELRHDALTGRLVLLATGRGARPFTTAPEASRPSGAQECPFCPGNEHQTPPEVARAGPGDPDTPGWRVRVVPNLYPIVGGEAAAPGATGAHEVVVLSPDHDATFGDLDDDQAVEVLTVLRERARAHATAGHAHTQVLVNEGRAAGASIEHPHAQLVALDFVPPAVAVALERFAGQMSDPVLADQAEAIGHEQGVIVGDEVRAWCPSGSASPYEVRVAALGADARFEHAGDGQVLGVAIVLRDVLAALARAARGDDGPPSSRLAYNVVLHDAPAGDAPYHWWIDVVPRVAVVAAFEMGTAVLVNTVDPATAARRLRDHL